MNLRSYIALLFLASITAQAGAQQLPKPPRLVVNIVVGQLRFDHLQRFAANISDRGLRRFVNEGVLFTDARYNFMQTTTPATLATLTTGADPATHGVVGSSWYDNTSNRMVGLIDDNSVYSIGGVAGTGEYSNINLTIPTLGDRLKEHHHESRVVSLALDPVSAIVMGGFTSEVYWFDQTAGNWTTSTAYADRLPVWVESYNSRRVPDSYLDYMWRPSLLKHQYVNRTFSVFELDGDPNLRKVNSAFRQGRRHTSSGKDYSRILRTPAGNSMVVEFVKQAVTYAKLGRGEQTDLLNVCFDSPRYAGEVFGGESIEFEDMFYRLDKEIGELLTFIDAQVGLENTVVVFTSDHGASDSYDHAKTPRDRFNPAQFRVVVNGFMNAQYGPGDWVLGYSDRQLYFNRDLVYNRNQSLEEVQNRVAAFCLNFRGVSHVLTSTALQSSSFHGGGFAQKMQNSYYPKRSGDIVINLMPGWIEEREGIRSLAGSMYEYDTHVPLMVLGPGVRKAIVTRAVNIRDLAPSLARMMYISRPIASEGEPIAEITNILE